jgi:hypothetical protein
VDGLEDSDDESVIVVDTETPFYVAVRKNAFKLADLLLSKGANINALSSGSSLLISDHSLTGLGHIVALNVRYCIPSIRYLLNSHALVISDATLRPGIAAASTTSATTDISDTLFNTVAFIVEPIRSLTALHFCAVVPSGLRYVAGNPLSRKDFDFETNSLITHELLDWFLGPEYLNERCALQGRTALHLAAQYSNVGVMKELVGAGADIGARDDDGMTAAEIVRSVHEQNEEVVSKMLRTLES